jgi:hypothetical protein
MPFDWSRFWGKTLKTIGCGPTTKLWIMGEGALEEEIEVELYYEDQGRFGQVRFYGNPNEPVAAWTWELTLLPKARKESDCLWAILPSRKGQTVVNTNGVHDLAKKFRRFGRIEKKMRGKWNRAARTRWQAEERIHRGRLREVLKILDAHKVPIKDHSNKVEWIIGVETKPEFQIHYWGGSDPLQKGDKVEIRFPRSTTEANPRLIDLPIRLNRKIVQILLRAGKISGHEAAALV